MSVSSPRALSASAARPARSWLTVPPVGGQRGDGRDGVPHALEAERIDMSMVSDPDAVGHDLHRVGAGDGPHRGDRRGVVVAGDVVEGELGGRGRQGGAGAVVEQPHVVAPLDEELDEGGVGGVERVGRRRGAEPGAEDDRAPCCRRGIARGAVPRRRRCGRGEPPVCHTAARGACAPVCRERRARPRQDAAEHLGERAGEQPPEPGEGAQLVDQAVGVDRVHAAQLPAQSSGWIVTSPVATTAPEASPSYTVTNRVVVSDEDVEAVVVVHLLHRSGAAAGRRR